MRANSECPERGVFVCPFMTKYLALMGLFLALPPIPSASSEAVWEELAEPPYAVVHYAAFVAAGAPERARSGRVTETERYTTITAYSSTPEETDDEPFITASGAHVRHGVIAANFLPFGTTVKIPELFGDRIFVVEDRMNKRYPDGIDIWMPSKQEARVFGKQTAKIVIIR